MTTTFTAILDRAVRATPNAIGGAFAASDGVMVGAVSRGDAAEWEILTAHYGVILGHLEAALGTWHFGGPEFFIAGNQGVSVVVHAVEDGYFTLLAVDHPASVNLALSALRVAAAQLRAEMR